MHTTLKQKISEALKELEINEIDFVVEHPAEVGHGDYSTNVALVAAKTLRQAQGEKSDESPRELAERIKTVLLEYKMENVEKIEVAGAGFINFFLSQDYFVGVVEDILKKSDLYGRNGKLMGRKVMIEYTDLNPFKLAHIGHLMSNAIGESLSRIMQFCGAGVIRATYQGDVGLHIAKAIWGKIQKQDITSGRAYSYGHEKYETDERAKTEIDEINKKAYSRSDEQINKIYDEGRGASLAEFEKIYEKLGTKFDKYYFESEMAKSGIEMVKGNTPGIFEESEGAIVFHGEKYDPSLHTRVFITKASLPTYEAKDIALAKRKFEDENPDLSIVVTGNEQKDYYRVVIKALSLIREDWSAKTLHVTHGMLRLPTGKMGSRKGNVITVESLIADVEKLAQEKMNTSTHLSDDEKNSVATDIAVGAIKYSILKQQTGKDIIFDFDKSLSFEGDSGPYLQYTFARAQSVLSKAKELEMLATWSPTVAMSLDEVGQVEKLLERFPGEVGRAFEEYAPQRIVTYLTELASAFNSYYAANKIVDFDNEDVSGYRLAVTLATSVVLKNGLWLLGIKAPERM